MKSVFVLIISIAFTMEISSQSQGSDRSPVAAGRFYSADRVTLMKDLSALFASVKTPVEKSTRAIVSPHAGYVFSGKAAALAFSVVPGNAEIKNIFIIGSSHVMAFDGASVYSSGDYLTPMGKAPVNREIAGKLKKDSPLFRFPETAHIKEHSIEVQIPFIQYHFDNMPQIVPIIIGTNNKSTIREISEALRPWFTKDNLFVISSDFSHYPSYGEAKVVDGLTADALVAKDPDKFLASIRKSENSGIDNLATAMCGWTSGLTLLYLINNSSELSVRKIYYCNSGDSPYGSKEEVVGYHAMAVISEEKAKDGGTSAGNDVSFTQEEKDILFRIARNSIRGMLFEQKRLIPDPSSIPASLMQKMGAFVTLKIKGELRGCIGRFTSNEPLYEVVNQMAIASAFEDHRFSPLTREEYGEVEIEISVLGPLRRISNVSEIVPGKHGIYIKKDFRSGTMLPQVAVENGWTTEQFLGYTSRDKAGLGWDGWKSAEVFIYEAVVLEEKHR